MVVETHVLFLFVFCILESCKISRSISKISTLTSYNIKTFRQSYQIGRMTYFGRLRCVYYTSYFRICYISKYEKRNQLTWKHSYQCFNLFQCIHFYRTLFSIMTPFGIIYFLLAQHINFMLPYTKISFFILCLHQFIYSGYLVDDKLVVEIFLIHRTSKSKIRQKQSNEMFKNIKFLIYFHLGLNNLFIIYFYNTSFMSLCKICRQNSFFHLQIFF